MDDVIQLERAVFFHHPLHLQESLPDMQRRVYIVELSIRIHLPISQYELETHTRKKIARKAINLLLPSTRNFVEQQITILVIIFSVILYYTSYNLP